MAEDQHSGGAPVDWVLAQWVATRLAGSPASGGPDLSVFDLEGMAADAQARIVAYTGLTPTTALPPAEPVSRGEWVQSNIAMTQAMVDPLLGQTVSRLARGKSAPLLMSAAITVEVGLLVGYLGSRVLGQYELALLGDAETDDPRLLMVMPNLSQAVKRLEAEPEQFLRWVTLHEVTHAVQFASVPWLRGHLGGLIPQMVAAAEQRVTPGSLKLPSRDELARVARAARAGDMIGMVAGEHERRLFDSAQAVMAVVEGHAEHVMDAVGHEVIPSLAELRQGLDRRRKQQGRVTRVVNRVLGMELKLRQYEQGKAFCDAIVAGGGTDALRYVFSSPQTMPTLSELQAPQSWLQRARPAL